MTAQPRMLATEMDHDGTQMENMFRVRHLHAALPLTLKGKEGLGAPAHAPSTVAVAGCMPPLAWQSSFITSYHDGDLDYCPFVS